MAKKRLDNISRYELGNMTKKELKSLYSQLRKETKKRAKTFKEHGAESVLPSGIRKPRAMKGLSKRQMANDIANMSSFLRSNISSYNKYITRFRAQKGRAEERLGIKLNNEDAELYAQFMDEMKERSGENWKTQYLEAMELFVQSRRLNIDPMKFKRNFDYWLEHSWTLEDAEPINKSNVKPSDYIKQLDLESIASWKNS